MISAILDSFARLSSSTSTDHRFASDDRPLRPPSLPRVANRGRRNFFVQKGSGAWGLDVRRSTGLCFLTVFPNLSVGTNPHRRSNLRMVVRPCDPPNPHAGLLPLQGALRFGSSSPVLPSHPTLR